MIRPAKIPEINDILSITRACAHKMKANGIHQWNEHYPGKNAFLRDLKREELYVKIHGNKLIGAIVVSSYMDAEYIPVQWLTPNGNSTYVHRVCIHPDYQGMGFARQLMDYAEEYSRSNNYKSVRLDTFSKNKRNQHFYEQRGYKRLGDIFFPKQSEHPFHCYELVL